MKKGDKVYCIKNNVIIQNGKLNHIKNKIYTIIDIEKDKGNTYCTINGEIRSTTFYNNTFNSYFVSLKKIRKQKLEKLNQTR